MPTGKKALLTLKCKTWALKVSKLIPHVLWKIHVPVLHTTWLKKKNYYSVIRIEVVYETVRVWQRLCQADIKKFVVTRRKRWGKISVRSPLGVKKRTQIGLL